MSLNCTAPIYVEEAVSVSVEEAAPVAVSVSVEEAAPSYHAYARRRRRAADSRMQARPGGLAGLSHKLGRPRATCTVPCHLSLCCLHRYG